MFSIPLVVFGTVECTDEIVFLYLDDVLILKSVPPVFLATISIECLQLYCACIFTCSTINAYAVYTCTMGTAAQYRGCVIHINRPIIISIGHDSNMVLFCLSACNGLNIEWCAMAESLGIRHC